MRLIWPRAVSDLWSLPLGAAGLDLALGGDPDLVPLVRDDVGGVLVGLGTVTPVTGTVYVDETRALSGSAAYVMVEPDGERGLAVTLIFRRTLVVPPPVPDLQGTGRTDRHRPGVRDQRRQALRPQDGSLDVLQAHRTAATGPRRDVAPRLRRTAVAPFRPAPAAQPGQGSMFAGMFGSASSRNAVIRLTSSSSSNSAAA